MNNINKAELVMMIGLPGSGKSTYCKDAGIVVSTDEIRKEVYGTYDIHADEFRIAEQRIIECLSLGQKVYFDACNVSRKSRKSLVNRIKSTLKKYHGIDIETTAIVVVTPIETCIERQKTRDRKVPKRAIINMARKFSFPQPDECFDHIRVAKGDDYNRFGLMLSYLHKMTDFNQKNIHHSLTLREHCEKAAGYFGHGTDFSDTTMSFVALFHDVGKLYTKEMKQDGNASYKGHANCGSYMALCMMDIEENDFGFYLPIKLIEYHMNFFANETKWKKTVPHRVFKNQIDANNFMDKLESLHNADLFAH